MIAVASDDETKLLDNKKARLIVDPQKEYLFVNGNPLSELSSNKDDHTDTKAIITTNIGVQDFDALWIGFYLHLILKIEKPIIVILNQEFYDSEKCWPSEMFDIVKVSL